MLDRVFKIAFAGVSDRTHAPVIEKWCRLTGYRSVLFRSVDLYGRPIYHTNVVMSIGEKIALVGMDTIPDPIEKATVRKNLEASGKTIVELTQDQLKSFAGNMLELRNDKGAQIMVMSRRAHEALRPSQLATIQQFCQPLIIDLDVIETVGGGSVRCMMAEIFLEPKASSRAY